MAMAHGTTVIYCNLGLFAHKPSFDYRLWRVQEGKVHKDGRCCGAGTGEESKLCDLPGMALACGSGDRLQPVAPPRDECEKQRSLGRPAENTLLVCRSVERMGHRAWCAATASPEHWRQEAAPCDCSWPASPQNTANCPPDINHNAPAHTQKCPHANTKSRRHRRRRKHEPQPTHPNPNSRSWLSILDAIASSISLCTDVGACDVRVHGSVWGQNAPTRARRQAVRGEKPPQRWMYVDECRGHIR